MLVPTNKSYPPKQSRKYAKRKSYYKKYQAKRKPNHTQVRGTR